jgi:hypothetical protein
VWYKPNQPSAILARSVMQTLQLQSAQFKASGDVSSHSFQLSGSASAKGAFDVSGSYKPKTDDRNIEAIQLQARSVDGNDIYVKLNGLSGLSTILGPQATQYGISATKNPFQSLDNVWLVIAKDSKDALLKNTQTGVGTATQLNSDEKNHVAAAYQRHPFIVVTKTLPDETVQGTSSRHYQAIIDKKALTAFAKEVQKTVPSLKLNDQKVASIQQANISSQPFDAWIAKDSGYISQIRYSDKPSATTVQLNLSNYNQPVQTTKPANAKPLFEALGSVLLGG